MYSMSIRKKNGFLYFLSIFCCQCISDQPDSLLSHDNMSSTGVVLINKFSVYRRLFDTSLRAGPERNHVGKDVLYYYVTVLFGCPAHTLCNISLFRASRKWRRCSLVLVSSFQQPKVLCQLKLQACQFDLHRQPKSGL